MYGEVRYRGPPVVQDSVALPTIEPWQCHPNQCTEQGFVLLRSMVAIEVVHTVRVLYDVERT